MIKKTLGWGGTLSMLTLAACGGSVQGIGDAVAGSGGSATAHAGSGTVQPHGGSSSSGSTSASTQGGSSSTGTPTDGRGGAAWAPGTCDPPCREGYGCYPLANDPAGMCAPLCDTPEQGQTADADLSCSNSVRGGVGQCVFSLSFGWRLPGGVDIPGLDNVITGLCSNACDPLAQDCPAGYTCDHTATYSAVAQEDLYACMPNKQPRAQGDVCYTTGLGECGLGLTCSLPNAEASLAHCEAFCDMRDSGTCPTNRTCTEDVITEQDNDPNIGVCL